MKILCRMSSRLRYATARRGVEYRVSENTPERANGHSSFVIRHLLRAFTLIELLTVIAIIGILAALLVPVLKHFAKPDATIAATRQMLDACARARQLAISQRSTVYMVFIPTNFWANVNAGAWTVLPPAVRASTVVTQLYAAQWNGYMMVSSRNVGDQPGRSFPRDVLKVTTLPESAFIAPFKFSLPPFGAFATPLYPTNRLDLPIYGFLRTNTIPFPTTDVLTNAGYVSIFNSGGGLTLPYIAFNYLGQLTSGDGTVLSYDENIPLSYGSILYARSVPSKAAIQGLPNAQELPAGNSTNISYNIIHIDHLTGRARLERQSIL